MKRLLRSSLAALAGGVILTGVYVGGSVFADDHAVNCPTYQTINTQENQYAPPGDTCVRLTVDSIESSDGGWLTVADGPVMNSEWNAREYMRFSDVSDDCYRPVLMHRTRERNLSIRCAVQN